MSKAWFQYVPDEADEDVFDNLEAGADLSTDGIQQIALKVDAALSAYYRGIAQGVPFQDLRDILTAPAGQLENDKTSLVWDAQRHKLV